MSINATKWVWDQQDIIGSAKLVLLRLADHADPDGGSVRPGIPSVAAHTGLSERSVQRYIHGFLNQGLIAIEANEKGGRGMVTSYCFPALKGDMGVAERVTPVSLKGDMGVAERVTPVSLKGDMGVAPLKEEPSRTIKEPPGTVTARASRGTIDDRFDRWYAGYPRKVGKEAARRVWHRLKPDDAMTDRLIAAVERHRQWPDWQREFPRFVPHPATWLNQGRWEDEAPDPVVVADGEADAGYIAAFGDANIDRLAGWLDDLSETFGGPGWVRSMLRRMATEVPGLPPDALKRGIKLGYDRAETRLSASDPPSNPPALVHAMFRQALAEQREVLR